MADDFEDIDPSSVKLGEKIGSGAFGDCFKAVFQGQVVAAKILRVQPGVDPEQQKRLEAQFKKELIGAQKPPSCPAPAIRAGGVVAGAPMRAMRRAHAGFFALPPSQSCGLSITPTS